MEQRQYTQYSSNSRMLQSLKYDALVLLLNRTCIMHFAPNAIISLKASSYNVLSCYLTYVSSMHHNYILRLYYGTDAALCEV